MQEANAGKLKLSSIKYFCLLCSENELYERKVERPAKSGKDMFQILKNLQVCKENDFRCCGI